MALSRAAGLCRLSLRTQWAVSRLLSSISAGGEPPGDDKRRGRLVDLEALRRERVLRPPPERKQPTPPRKAHNTSRPTREQLQLNADIVACASAEAVLDLAASRPALLNGVIVSTALMKLAKLIGKGKRAQWLESDARFQQLLSATVALMEHKVVEARGFANLLYACGQLGITPPADWLQSYWHASASKLGEFSEQGLSNTLFACGQLGITPPADWLQRYWHSSSAKLGEFSEQGLSNVIYACGQLGITPSVDWLQRYWHTSASKLGEFSTQGLSNTVYACGQLGITPPADWLQQYWHASALKLGEFKPQHYSNTLYACGQLGIKPPAD